MFETNMLQNKDELAWFIDILRRENVCSYLEIGSMFGGSLWQVTRALPVGSRVVAIDLPKGTIKWEKSQASLEACQLELEKLGYDCHTILADSTSQATVGQVSGLGPFDACFIDGGHTWSVVKQDWENYGLISRIVAFHDIAWKGPRPGKLDCDVPQFWESIKQDYRHEEIRLEPRDLGIGVLWRI